MHLAATDHGELMTPVASKRRSLLITGHDDEVYVKNHQHYAEDNGAAFRPKVLFWGFDNVNVRVRRSDHQNVHPCAV